MDKLLSMLRAIAEPTRLRLLALLRDSELTVTELTRILGQSQPRVSRHLKLLCDAGLLERHQEGSWVFHRLASASDNPRFAHTLLDLVPVDDTQLSRDRSRLAEIRRERREQAESFFRRNAASWDRIRIHRVDESEVERLLLASLPIDSVRQLVDLGTGTGRMLEVYAPHIASGIGVDRSHEMLAVARSKLERAALAHCQVRHGDIFNPPLAPRSADLVTLHHVLHFLDDPAAAIREAANLLMPGGRLHLVDYAPHAVEAMRTELAHRRLGFEAQTLAQWCHQAGLANVRIMALSARDPAQVVWGEESAITLPASAGACDSRASSGWTLGNAAHGTDSPLAMRDKRLAGELTVLVLAADKPAELKTTQPQSSDSTSLSNQKKEVA